MADIGIAASARDWPDRLHRHVLDHGGGRVVGRLMGPDQVADTSFDVLVIDDVCSFLNPRLVEVVKSGGAEVLGVYAPEDGSSAKRRLLECGISDVIETEAAPEEFIQKINSSLAHRAPTGEHQGSGRKPLAIGVTGPCAGVGTTEIAIAIGAAIAADHTSVLVDLDPVWPSVAQRLDLPVHPNVRTAFDYALHRPDKLGDAILSANAGLRVIGGRADGGQGEPVARHDVISLLVGLAGICDVVVADLGPETTADPSLFREFDTVLVVGTADPVGVSRLVRSADRLMARHPQSNLLAVANFAGRAGYHRSEVLAELTRALPDLPVATIPHDRKVVAAMWNGSAAYGSRLKRDVDAIADLVSEVITR